LIEVASSPISIGNLGWIDGIDGEA